MVTKKITLNELRTLVKQIIKEENEIIDYSDKSIKFFLEKKGFQILKNGIVKYNNIEIVLFMQREYFIHKGQPYMRDIDNDDKKIAVLDGIINTGERGIGAGSNTLDLIIKAADATNTILEIFVKPIGKKGLNKKQLTDWYKKRGFDIKKDDEYNMIMERLPK
jgi:hypothetical protein